jgi:hypothetical protein
MYDDLHRSVLLELPDGHKNDIHSLVKRSEELKELSYILRERSEVIVSHSTRLLRRSQYLQAINRDNLCPTFDLSILSTGGLPD